MDSYVQTVSSIQFELDEDLSDDDMAKGSVATKSKERLEVGEIDIIQLDLECYKPTSILHKCYSFNSFYFNNI